MGLTATPSSLPDEVPRTSGANKMRTASPHTVGDHPVNDLSRRHFLGASSAGLLALTAARAADSNERLSIGIVGPGGRGRGVLGTTLKLAKAHRAEVTA